MNLPTILERAHSPLGPSSFERIEACPASAVLGAEITTDNSSIFADEGTAAHEMFETCMKNGHDPWEYLDQSVTFGKATVVMDPRTVETLTIAVNDARARLGSRTFECEVRLQVPGTVVFGTSDIYAGGQLPVKVLDLKYGAGVQVMADSVQLGLYALMGLLRDFGDAIITDGDGAEILAETTVLQPRGSGASVRDGTWSRDQLRDLLGRVRMAVDRFQRRELGYNPGEHCRWCSAVGVCPKLAQVASDAALSEVVQNPNMPITAEAIDLGMTRIEALKIYIKQIEAFAEKYLLAGGVLANAKLVSKKASRSWIDTDAAADWLTTHGLSPYNEPTMKSPTQAEKGIPKGLRVSFDELVTKESSGLTIAPMTDARPAVVLIAERGRAALAQSEARALLQRTKTSPLLGGSNPATPET